MATVMKFILLAAVLIYMVSGNDDIEWTRYKEAYKKVYTTEYENIRRFEQYLKNKLMVEEHNKRHEKGETSYKMAVNKFSDWFPEEISNLTAPTPVAGLEGRKFEPEQEAKVPDSINWVTKGAVTAVKDQHHCASYYAFSSVGALEGLMFRSNKTIANLSSQELIDCSGNNGCNGGSFLLCLYYVMKRPGIDTEKSYPYEGFQRQCRANRGLKGAYCNGLMWIGDEQTLKQAVGTVGPVSVGFASDNSFIHYDSGVFDGSCSANTNHALLVVGYGVDQKTKEDYWLMKNSWGVKWGEKGYAKVVRDKNKCGLADIGSLPLLLKNK